MQYIREKGRFYIIFLLVRSMTVETTMCSSEPAIAHNSSKCATAKLGNNRSAKLRSNAKDSLALSKVHLKNSGRCTTHLVQDSQSVANHQQPK